MNPLPISRVVTDATLIKRRAPTLYAIVAIKLVKGLLLLLLGFGVYQLSDADLPDVLRQTVMFCHLDPENAFFTKLATKIGAISESGMVWIAGGTVLYSLLLLVEGGGLVFRVSWAGWLAIGESAFFIPIEIHELIEHSSWAVLVILGINILIVWYLFQNRRRLFRHHQH